MANNYLQSSFAFTLKGMAGFEVKEHLENINLWLLEGTDPRDDPDYYWDDEKKCFDRLAELVAERAEAALTDLFDYHVESNVPSSDGSSEDETDDVDDDMPDEDVESEVFIFHNDDACIDLAFAIAVAQVLLDLAKCDEVFCASYAFTCSKPRTGEFGGGMTVFSRHGKQTMRTDHEMFAFLKAVLLEQDPMQALRDAHYAATLAPLAEL
jgi:hypothetical protein